MIVTRRAVLRDVLAAGAGLVVLSRCASLAASPAGWDAMPDLLRRIVPPRFPQRDFAVAGYKTINDAIEACHRAGGGRVVVPAGDHLTGPIRLRSRVELHLAAGATVRFSRDPADYPLVLTRWEGVELMNYSPLVYAFECEDVAVTGEGTLDGQADESHWWLWKGNTSYGWTAGAPNYNAARQRLLAMAENGTPVAQRVFGEATIFGRASSSRIAAATS